MDSSQSGPGQDRPALPFHPSQSDHPWWDRSLVGQFLSRSPVGIAVMDPELRYLWLNDALARMGGVSREERIGKRIGEVLPRMDAETVENAMHKVIATGEPAIDVEYWGRLPADPDREHAYSTSFFRLDDASGQVRGVCYMVIDVTERWRARERLALLNEAGARTASTLDVTRIAQALAEVGVPRLADFVAVDLMDPVVRGEPSRGVPPTGPYRLRRVGRHAIAADTAAPLAGAGATVEFAADSPGARCLAEGASYAPSVLHDDAGDWLAAAPRETAAADGGGGGPGLPCSLMLVPVGARDSTLGVATFLRWQGRETFDGDDLLLAQELVARAAVGIDNARRFAQEHNTALALQRFLLPHRLTARSTMEVASRYLPAGSDGGESGDVRVGGGAIGGVGGGVGGDWFDVIPLSGGRVGLVIGDVVGHGLGAAAAMSRFHTAVRTLADLDLPPAELLAHLDDLVLSLLGEEPSEGNQPSAVLGATCLYAVYDPVTLVCSMARAAHPAPGIVAPDGSVTFPDLPSGPPLGLGGLPFESIAFDLPEGSVLALYTNGLIKNRGQDMDVGLERLRAALARPGLPLEGLCSSVLDSLLDGPPEDDVALLLARTHSLDADRVATWTLPADPSFVAEARALAQRQLEEWGLEELAFPLELIVSELVTNAVRHASGPIRLRLIRQNVLVCEVADTSSTAPRLRHARTTDEGGRGLFLVAQLAQRWGTRYTAEGKIIWAEHPLPPVAAA
ncbi:SpoIIE family protein phosphatase [Streptomyces sp. NPDC002004]